MDKPRILAVLLEGDSDRATFEKGLRLLVKSLFLTSGLQVMVFRGDPTINDSNGDPIDPSEVEDNISAYIEKELRENRLTKEDLFAIIHIGDLDAVYCLDEQVIHSHYRRPYYDPEQKVIFTNDVFGTIKRNERKRDSLDQLFVLEKMLSVPYRFFYVGINLEHAFYEKPNCTSDEKTDYGYNFERENVTDLSSFLNFISGLPSEGQSYEDSCAAARRPEMAFVKITNLRFIAEFLKKQRQC